MKRTPRLTAIAIVGVLAIGCGDSALVVSPTPGTLARLGDRDVPGVGHRLAVGRGDHRVADRQRGGGHPGLIGSASRRLDALRWSQPVTISVTAVPADILFWQGAYVAVGSDGRPGGRVDVAGLRDMDPRDRGRPPAHRRRDRQAGHGAGRRAGLPRRSRTPPL